MEIVKICSQCKKEKVLSEFTKRKRLKFGVDRLCKKCRRVYERQYYKKNQLSIRERVVKSSLTQRRRNIQYTVDYLLEHPCIDCGEKDPIVLEFDHRDAEDKRDAISHLCLRGFSLETIQKEIDKCDVRCANCHRRKTRIQLGWNKDIRYVPIAKKSE